jgi:hypothetical protein
MEQSRKRKEWLKKQLREISTSAAAGAYSTPFAFNPKKGAKGTARNYYLDMGYKLVNQQQLRKKAKGIEYKDLWK